MALGLALFYYIEKHHNLYFLLTQPTKYSSKVLIKHKHFLILTVICILCVCGHFLSPPSWGFMHEFLFKFTYLPIILAAIWYGRWFAFKLVIFFCIIYLLHIFTQLYHHAHHNTYSIFFDLGLYFMIAWVTGHLSDKEKQKSLSLKDAYATLREKTELLVEYEDNARNNERYKVMGELAGTVAHEVRTPLSALQGAVEIVTSPETNDDSKKKFTSIIFSEIQRIDGVIKNFLNLGKSQTSSLKSIQLATFFNECQILLQPIVNKNKIKFNINIPSNISVYANENQLKQVIINLIVNSVSATKHSQGEINISAMQCESNIHISISDNGSGINNDFEDKLFSPFNTTKSDGSGLGLYLSRNIIRSFDGELNFNRDNKDYTEFTIILPLKIKNA